MTLYEMLDATLYFQEVWIYEGNIFDQNRKLFKGRVEEARADEIVWEFLQNEVCHYECDMGILVIRVKGKHFEEKFEECYPGSGKNLKKHWSALADIRQEVKKAQLH